MSSLKRSNESPKPDCQVCSDDSSFIAVANFKNLQNSTLAHFVEKLLPDCLEVDLTESLLVEFNGKIIYERDPDLSEDEIERYSNRLTKSLTSLNFTDYSIVYLKCKLMTI